MKTIVPRFMRLAFTSHLVLSSFYVNAQLLNTTEITPHIGESFQVYPVTNAAALESGNPGINQTWDLSNLTFNADTFIVKQVIPAPSSLYADLFPGATQAIQSYYSDAPDETSYAYYTDTGVTYCYQGYVGVLTHLYSDALKEFHFPFGFNNHTHDNYCLESTGFGASFSYCGSSDMHFDGVGELVLPYGTYNGVFRMKHTKRSWQTANPMDTAVHVVYYWYKPDIHHPLAVYDVFTGSNGATIVSANLLSLSTINAISETPTSSLTVYPNPFHQVVHIGKGHASAESIARIFSMDGKQLYQETLNGDNATLMLDHLPSGAYLLNICSDGVVQRRLLLKE